METKHTKGEWHVNSTGVFNKDGKLIANCVSDGIHFTEEDKANAKLIAAAPDLLEALDELQHEVQMQCSIGSDPRFLKMCELWQNAKQAINKATK